MFSVSCLFVEVSQPRLDDRLVLQAFHIGPHVQRMCFVTVIMTGPNSVSNAHLLTVDMSLEYSHDAEKRQTKRGALSTND